MFLLLLIFWNTLYLLASCISRRGDGDAHAMDVELAKRGLAQEMEAVFCEAYLWIEICGDALHHNLPSLSIHQILRRCVSLILNQK